MVKPWMKMWPPIGPSSPTQNMLAIGAPPRPSETTWASWWGLRERGKGLAALTALLQGYDEVAAHPAIWDASAMARSVARRHAFTVDEGCGGRNC